MVYIEIVMEFNYEASVSNENENTRNFFLSSPLKFKCYFIANDFHQPMILTTFVFFQNTWKCRHCAQHVLFLLAVLPRQARVSSKFWPDHFCS